MDIATDMNGLREKLIERIAWLRKEASAGGNWEYLEARWREAERILKMLPENQVRCRSCDGSGRWETECCNGSGGCSCRGQVIPMGACNVCQGTGWHAPDANTRANIEAIQGQCFIGSGPTDGSWP